MAFMNRRGPVCKWNTKATETLDVTIQDMSMAWLQALIAAFGDDSRDRTKSHFDSVVRVRVSPFRRHTRDAILFGGQWGPADNACQKREATEDL